VQAQISVESEKQNKLSRIPTLGFSGSSSLNSGLNQNPITFSRETQTYLAAGMQLQSSADIFNFFSKQHAVAAAEWETMAAKAGVDKLRYDVALAVANAYLQILLAKEQEKIAAVQLEQTSAQLENTRKLVNAGALPELNAAQLEAQLSQDSVNFISARGNVQQSILAMQKSMALDPANPFDIATPPVESIPVEPLADLQPEFVFKMAVANQPLQKVNFFKLKAAQYSSQAAKSAMLPTLGAFASLGTSFFNKAQEITGTKEVYSPIGSVDINNTVYQVYPFSPYSIPLYGKSSLRNQLSDNFRQVAGLSLSVPIFSGNQLRSNYERSRLNLRSVQIQQENDNNQLKQDIYQAYNAAMVSLQKFNASQRTVETTEKTFRFAEKRYAVGMLSTFELITAQNNLFRAKLEYSLNHFDYVFKLKVLEYYKGLGIKM
jgi:outer membrane protein